MFSYTQHNDCFICISPEKDVPNTHFEVICDKCNKNYFIAADAINDWLIQSQVVQRKNFAKQYILANISSHNNPITTLEIAEAYHKKYPI